MAGIEVVKPYVRVLYTYDYKDDVTDNDIQLKEGDEYELTKKTNDDWWSVLKEVEGHKKPFYIPAKYVKEFQKKVTRSLGKFARKQSESDTLPKKAPQTKLSDHFDPPPVTPKPSSRPNSSEQPPPVAVKTPRGSSTSEPPPPVATKPANNNSRPQSQQLDSFIKSHQGDDSSQNVSTFKLGPRPKAPSAPQPAIPPPEPAPDYPRDNRLSALDALDKVLFEFDIDDEPAYSNGLVGQSGAGDDEEDYANADAIRTEVQRRLADVQEEAPSYANMDELRQGTLTATPVPNRDSTPIKVLDAEWQMHMDSASGRAYFLHVPSGRTQWKPPRIPSTMPPEIPKLSAEQDAKRLSNGQRSPSGLPRGWRQDTDENGAACYRRGSSNESWYSSTNAKGQTYYYNGTGSSCWALPPADKQSDPAPPDGSSSVFVAGAEDKRSKRVSAPPAETHAPPVEFLQQKKGVLLRAKISEDGKKINYKPFQKQFTSSYAVMSGTTLLCYKDDKAAQLKERDIPPMPELALELSGATIGFGGKDAKTNKKNVFQVTCGKSVYMFQGETPEECHEWYIACLQASKEEQRRKASSLPQPPQMHQQVYEREKKAPLKRSKTEPVMNVKHAQEMDKERTALLEKLRYFLKRRPTAESLQAKGILKDAVFGASLEELCKREKTTVPKFVVSAVKAIEKRGLASQQAEGMYRVGGNVAVVNKLRNAVDQDMYNLDSPEWELPVLCGALKMFFRELKDPLFPSRLFNKFVGVIRIPDPKARKKSMRDLVKSLSRTRYDTMAFLFQHLLNVVDESARNKMDHYNVAIVFGPNLLYPELSLEALQADMAVNAAYQNKIVEFCLFEYKYIFDK